MAGGLDGIEKKTEPGEPRLGNMYERSLDEVMASGVRILPQSRWEAIGELKNDRTLLLGDELSVSWVWLAGDGLRPRVIWEIPAQGTERHALPAEA